MESHVIGAISVAAFSAAWQSYLPFPWPTLFTGWETRSRTASRGRMISWMKWKKVSRLATGSSTHYRDTSGHRKTPTTLYLGHRMTSNHPRQNMNVRSHMAASRKPFSRFYLGLAGSKLSPRLAFKTQKQPKDPLLDVEESIKLYVPHHDQSSLTEARDKTLYTLLTCQHIIAMLKVNRLQIYCSYWAHMIISRVCNAHPKIDGLFFTAAKDLQHLIHEFEKMMLEAECEETILQGLDWLEAIVENYSQCQHKKVHEILGGLHNSIEVINVAITEDLFVDMKCGVFALDEACDYHPGNPQAEAQEREYFILLRPQEPPRTALSPGWYHDWQDIYVDLVRELRQNGINYVRINGQPFKQTSARLLDPASPLFLLLTHEQKLDTRNATLQCSKVQCHVLVAMAPLSASSRGGVGGSAALVMTGAMPLNGFGLLLR